MSVGLVVGAPLGDELGAVIGVDVGTSLGEPLGALLGVSLGWILGLALGSTEGDELGPEEGDKLVLGAVLGAGLLLGTVLGMSVGHGSLVGEAFLQTPKFVIAVGPNKKTSTFETKGTSKTMFLKEFWPPDDTANDRVAPSTSVTCTHTSSTTLRRPISITSSTGVANSKVMIPPNSFAFHCAFPPVS